MIERIAEELASLDSVKAIALSGSRTSAIKDNSSDWDIYVYSAERVPLEERKRIFSAAAESRIDCSPFEEGDEVAFSDGTALDIMYRSVEWSEWQVEDVWEKHNARVGYTTCFIYNISTSEIIKENDGWFRALQKKTQSEYPERLRDNIINKNMDVLCGSGSSTFLKQAELAYKRSDIVSQSHRLSAILASYFDVLFAYNRVLHPGEKKLQRYVHLLCPSLPVSFDEDIERAILSVGRNTYVNSIKTLLCNLSSLLGK